jgi:hypothetical protein
MILRKDKLTYRHLVVPQHLGTGLGDDRDIDVGTGTQIVEDTGSDSPCDKSNRLGSLFVSLMPTSG